MRIIVDLDGVCYEFCRTVRYMLNHYLGMELPSVSVFWRSWWPSQIGQDEWKWVWTEGVRLGLFRYGHMTGGTRIALDSLVSEGHSLGIATTRPMEAQTDTLDWISLFFHRIPLRGGIHFTVDKWQIAGDVLIDDSYENCSAWMENAPVFEKERAALLFDQPWNQQTGHTDEYLANERGIYRVHGWEEAVSWVRNRQTSILAVREKPSSESFRSYFAPPRETERTRGVQGPSPHGTPTRRTRLLSSPIVRDTSEESLSTRIAEHIRSNISRGAASHKRTSNSSGSGPTQRRS
jgi:deoxypyrimidine-specific 5' nucleotidase type C protein (NT5C)